MYIGRCPHWRCRGALCLRPHSMQPISGSSASDAFRRRKFEISMPDNSKETRSLTGSGPNESPICREVRYEVPQMPVRESGNSLAKFNESEHRGRKNRRFRSASFEEMRGDCFGEEVDSAVQSWDQPEHAEDELEGIRDMSADRSATEGNISSPCRTQMARDFQP